MNKLVILKTLANDTRLQILHWLKYPKKHFKNVTCDGVCCGAICEKTGLSQSTTSGYLNMLERAGLITAKRCGQWTYFSRNEMIIKQFIAELHNEL